MTVRRVGTPQSITEKSSKVSSTSTVLVKAKTPRLIDLTILNL